MTHLIKKSQPTGGVLHLVARVACTFNISPTAGAADTTTKEQTYVIHAATYCAKDKQKVREPQCI